MPEIRKDPFSHTWVILSPERKLRPQTIRPTYETTPGDQPFLLNLPKEICPFCPGNESMTPPEIYALRPHPLETNQPGWSLRVIPNKYPALRVEGNLDKQGEGFYDKLNGIGAHEVIIETPDHDTGIGHMAPGPGADVFITFKQRIADLKKDIRFRYIQVFKNHGSRAGATIAHPHCQVIALPVIPSQLNEIISHAHQHYITRERCIFCDMLHHETQNRQRILLENNHFIVLAPYAPRFPFQLAIYPRTHQASYEQSNDGLLNSLATTFHSVIQRLNRTLENPAYNMALYNAPFNLGEDGACFFHWHIDIIPILSATGGLEIATNTYINAIPPEEAIQILKKT